MDQDGAVATATVCQHISKERTTGAKTGKKKRHQASTEIEPKEFRHRSMMGRCPCVGEHFQKFLRSRGASALSAPYSALRPGYLLPARPQNISLETPSPVYQFSISATRGRSVITDRNTI